MYYTYFLRHPPGADLPHHDPLGTGIIHSEPRAGAADVQPAAQAVRRPRRAHSSTAQSLRHQRCVCSGHHGPSGVFGPNTVPAYCPDGPRRGATHDSEHWVSVGGSDLHYMHFIFSKSSPSAALSNQMTLYLFHLFKNRKKNNSFCSCFSGTL